MTSLSLVDPEHFTRTYREEVLNVHLFALVDQFRESNAVSLLSDNREGNFVA